MNHSATCLALVLALSLASAEGARADAAPTTAPQMDPMSQAIVTAQGDPTRAVVLIDRTGSMRTVRSGSGETRCFGAVEQARVDALGFLNGATEDDPPRGVAFWLFSGAIGIQQVGEGYFTDVDELNAALDTIPHEDCPATANTPLADALCRVAGGFADGRPALSPRPGALFVETDGSENNSTGPCEGRTSDLSDSESWTRKVLFTMLDAGITVHTQFWHSNGRITSAGDELDVETGKPRPAISTQSSCGTQAACESQLFEALAFWTVGSYGVVADDDVDYTCAYPHCPAPKPPR